MLRITILSVFLLLFIPSFTIGQGIFEEAVEGDDFADITDKTFSYGGYSRASAWFGGENYDYASVFGEFAMQGRISGNNMFLWADVRFADGMFFGERESLVNLREAYAGIRWENVDVYLGNQIVRWGRTDGFNPVDNISPRNHFFLSTDPDDQLKGNFMLRTRIRPLPSTELEVVAIPYYEPSVYRYDLFEMDEGVTFNEGVLPEASFSNGSVGMRLTTELPSVGLSLTYFTGYDPFYGFDLESYTLFPEREINYRPRYYRKNSPGIDMSFTAGQAIFRLEAAYNITSGYSNQIYIPNPEIYYVGAIESSFWGINTILQYIGKYVLDYQFVDGPAPPDMQNPVDIYRWAVETVSHESEMYNRRIFQQQEEMNHAMFLSFSRSFLYEELRAEVTTYYNITSEEYLIRPEIKWNARDGMMISAGAQFMNGPDVSIYNMAGKVLGGFFTGISVSF